MAETSTTEGLSQATTSIVQEEIEQFEREEWLRLKAKFEPDGSF